MKITYIVAALGVAFLGGFFLKQRVTPPCPVLTATKAVVQEKVITHTVVKTVRPDGTVIVKTVERDLDKSEKTSSNQTTTPLAQYRVGGKVHSGVDFKPSIEPIVGYRLNNSTWLEGGYNIQKKELSLGVSLEF